MSFITSSIRPLKNLTRASPLLYTTTRSITSTIIRSAPTDKMPPPPKKMHHLQAINAIPSQYPEFRNVLWTGESSQLVVMTVPVGGDIGEEVHGVDQHLIFTSGVCKAIVGGEEKEVKAGDMVIVPQGTKHNCEYTLVRRIDS
jgi:mannose-6-phosphate isomerase-like protein (cupin superfamily)